MEGASAQLWSEDAKLEILAGWLHCFMSCI